MKKGLFLVLLLSFVLMMTACQTSVANKENTVAETKHDTYESTSKSERVRIVCTSFPQYNWARIITKGGSNARVKLLLNDSTDIHNFQPTDEDIATINKADMIIYVGGESDKWVEDVLQDNGDKQPKLISLVELIEKNVKQETPIDGVVAQVTDKDSNSEQENKIDEHICLSVKNAQELVRQMVMEITLLDPENVVLYQNNSKKYLEALAELEQDYQAMADNATNKTLIFVDRIPFRYLLDDYNFKYFAAFSGCSAETEPNPETVAFLANKIDELGLKEVFVIVGNNTKIADVVIENSKTQDVTIYALNAMESITAADVKAGANYLDIMKENLAKLTEALD